MKYFVDILKQFTVKQRMFVLILLLLFSSITFITTTYLKSGYNSCDELIELNQKYVQDFIKISDMIRRERMNDLGLTESTILDSSVRPQKDDNGLPASSAPEETSNVILDSIQFITETNIK